VLTCISDCSLLSVNVYLIQEPLNVVVQQLLMELKWYRMLGSAGMCMRSNSITHTHSHHRFSALFPGPRGWAAARRKLLLDFYGAREDNRGRHIDHPAGRYSVRINQRPPPSSPPFLRHMPFLSQPSHFILAWDRHQICWLCIPCSVVYSNTISNNTLII